MQKVLVTGATGLLGAEVVSQLAAKGIEVHAFVRNLPKQSLVNVTFHQVDLGSNIDSGISELPEDLDCIFHLSQAREFRDFPQSAQKVFDINVASTVKLLDFAQKTDVTNFVYASSGGVYEANPVNDLREDSNLQGPDKLGFYLSTKLSGECLSLSYSNLFNVSVLRYFFIYGPGQDRGMLIPRLFDSVKESKTISLTSDQGMVINPVHVTDAAAATILAGTHSTSEIINIAGPSEISLRQICELFSCKLKVPPVFDVVEGAKPKLVANTELMSSLLRKPRILIQESISDIIPK